MTDYQPNDKVQHPGKPEWGTGTVLTAQKASHEGTPCQRLTVRFSGAGKKTINTAFAKLKRLEAAPQPEPAAPSPASAKPQPAAAASDAGAQGEPQAPPPPRPATSDRPNPNDPPPEKPLVIARLTALPEGLDDPFRSVQERIERTCAAYRYRPGDRTLLEWAVAQTGLADPLSVLSRHELEEHYATFRIRLDRHLKALLEEARRSRVETRPIIDAAAPDARAEVQHALRRINPGR